MDDAKFRAAMLDEGVVVAGALGAYAGKAFRLATWATSPSTTWCGPWALWRRALKACGADVKLGTAVGVYMEEMSK